MYGISELSPSTLEPRSGPLTATTTSADHHNGSGAAVGLLPTTSPSLDSSTSSSFFSLANSTGFRSPLNADSGQRAFTRSHDTAGEAEAFSKEERGAATRLFGQSYDLEGRSSRTNAEPVPIAHPKASRPLLSQTPPAVRVPGFATVISTRGSQRHHIAFSDSPPPPARSPGMAGQGSRLALSAAQMPNDTPFSAKDAFAVSSGREDNAGGDGGGPLRDGLHASFGLSPSLRLASRLTLAEGLTDKVVSTMNSGLVYSATSPFKDVRHRLSPSRVAAAGAPQASTVSASADGAAFSGSTSGGKDGRSSAVSNRLQETGVSSSYDSNASRLSKGTLKTAVAASLTAQPPRAHRYQEADEESSQSTAVTAAVNEPTNGRRSAAIPPPPSLPLTAVPITHVTTMPAKEESRAANATTFSTKASPLTVTDCTSSAGQRLNEDQQQHQQQRDFLAEHTAKPTQKSLLRRSSVSAAPFVPAAWRPTARERSAKIDAPTADITTTASVDTNAGGEGGAAPPHHHPPVVHSPVHRPTFTLLEDRARNLVGNTNKPAGLHQPAVRFIYTRSRSDSKAASPDRPLGPTPNENGEAAAAAPPPPAVTLAAPSAAHQPQQQQQQRGQAYAPERPGRATVHGTALPTLRRSTDPFTSSDHSTRRPAASVAFTRSATTASMTERERERSRQRPSRSSPDASAVGSSSDQRLQSATRGEGAKQGRAAAAAAAAVSGGRGSRTCVADFDAAPQSYLSQWRQRQEMKQARMTEAAAAVGAAATGSPSNTVAVNEEKKKVEQGTTPTEVSPQPPPTLQSAITVSHAAATTSKVEEVKPQLSAPATNASWRRGRDAPSAAPTQTGATTAVYSLSEALRSSSLPATASNTTTTKEESTPESAALPPPPPSTTNSDKLSVAHCSSAPPEATMLSKTAGAITSTTPHNPNVPSNATVLTAPSIGSSAAAMISPGTNSSPSFPHAAASTRKASLSTSGSCMAEECERRASVSEDIPADQVLAPPPPPPFLIRHPVREEAVPTPATQQPLASTSPRRSSNTESGEKVDIVKASVETHQASRTLSTINSARLSTCRRPTSQQQQPNLDTTSTDSEARTVETPGGRGVRDIYRTVLERREQRLQQRQSEEKASGRETPLMRVPTPLPPSPPAGADETRKSTAESVATAAAVSDVVEVSRSPSRLATASARRTTTTTPYTPPWKMGIAAGSSRSGVPSRPPSTQPEPIAASAEGKASPTASPLPVVNTSFTAPALSRAVTPPIEDAPTHSRVASVTVTSLAVLPQQQQQQTSTLPSRCATPSSGVAPASASRNECMSSAVAAGTAAAPLSDMEGGEDEGDQASNAATAAGATTRISQLLARRTSFTHRLSASADMTAMLDTDAAATLPPLPTVAHSMESVAPSHVDPVASAETAGAAAAVTVAARPSVSFDMAAAMESIPTAADIEREARVAEQRASVSERGAAEPVTMAKDDAPTSAGGEASSSTGARAAQTQPRPLPAFAAPTPPPPLPSAEPKAAPAVQPASSSSAPSPAATLAAINVDELDKLEQSVNALLKHYGTAAVNRTPEKEANATPPKKMTAADILLSQMPDHAVTAATKKAAKAAARLAHSSTSHNASSASATGGKSSKSGSLRAAARRTSQASEWEDEDSQWDASLLWCGEESGVSQSAPPTCVPPLDLSMLMLPTNAFEDLKPYRIPLPSAVPAPEENRRQLLKLAGLLSTGSSASPQTEVKNSDSAPYVDGSRRSSGAVPLRKTSAASSSSRANHSSQSLTDVSPFVGERIRAMRDQPTLPAARSLRPSRRTSANLAAETAAAVSVRGVDGDEKERTSKRESVVPSQESSEDEEAEDEEDSVCEAVDDAPQRVARVVHFTDDSDALDGGRGAARDMRVGQQKSRVRALLLDCEEQRERKLVLVEEQGAFAVIGKSFRRSSLLT